jgi:hypothetical protein
MSKIEELLNKIDGMREKEAERIADCLLEDDAAMLYQAHAVSRRAQIIICAARQENRKTADITRSLEPALQAMYYIGYATALREWSEKLKQGAADDAQRDTTPDPEG